MRMSRPPDDGGAISANGPAGRSSPAAVAGALRVGALMDIKRRPASQMRGRKRVWAAASHSSAAQESCRSRTSSSGGVGTLIRLPPQKRRVRLARADPSHGYRGQRLVSFMYVYLGPSPSNTGP